MRRFNVDNFEERRELLRQKPVETATEIYPRRTLYGSDEARVMGLQPLGEVPDVVVPEGKFKEALAAAHKTQTLPMYWQNHTWGPRGFQWNQDGLGYCWAWSGTGCLMDTRATERKETVLLAPVSMGWLVNWQDRGNYLEDFIRGAREKGIAPGSCVPDSAWHTPDPNAFDPCWETERANYRLGQVWDCDPRRMMQHCLSILTYSRPLYIAYNWWGHALEMVGMRYDGDTLVKIIRNSHNEDDFIELEGQRSVPDEAYGFINTVTP